LIVFFNLLGLGFLILALVIAFGVLSLFPELNGPPFWFIAFGLLALIDLAYRYLQLRPRLQQKGKGDICICGSGTCLGYTPDLIVRDGI